MSLTDKSKIAIALKKLAGRAMTSGIPDEGLANEALPTNIMGSASTTFAETVPDIAGRPGSAGGDATTELNVTPGSITDTDGVVVNASFETGVIECVRLQLEEIVGSSYDASTLLGLTNDSVGPHAYFARLPSDYEDNSNNERRANQGTQADSVWGNSAPLYLAQGKIQCVPPIFGSDPSPGGTYTDSVGADYRIYGARLYDDTGAEQSISAGREWYFDYYNGILFQDRSVKDADDNTLSTPGSIEVLLYIGDFVSDRIGFNSTGATGIVDGFDTSGSDNNKVWKIVAGEAQWILSTDADTLGDVGACADGEIIKWDASLNGGAGGWGCAPDEGGGEDTDWWEAGVSGAFNTTHLITTSSVAIGVGSTAHTAIDMGQDTFFFVGGTAGSRAEWLNGNPATAPGVAHFGGDLALSGNLAAGSAATVSPSALIAPYAEDEPQFAHIMTGSYVDIGNFIEGDDNAPLEFGNCPGGRTFDGFDQSTQQAFYLIDTITIPTPGGGTRGYQDGADGIGIWNAAGATYCGFESGGLNGVWTVPAMGRDGNQWVDYFDPGDPVQFIIWDDAQGKCWRTDVCPPSGPCGETAAVTWSNQNTSAPYGLSALTGQTFDEPGFVAIRQICQLENQLRFSDASVSIATSGDTQQLLDGAIVTVHEAKNDSGGDIEIYAGDNQSSTGLLKGGDITLISGEHINQAGTAGVTSWFTGVNGASARGGNIEISSGGGDKRSGDIHLYAADHLSKAGIAGNIHVRAGKGLDNTDTVGPYPSAGNVAIAGGRSMTEATDDPQGSQNGLASGVLSRKFTGDVYIDGGNDRYFGSNVSSFEGRFISTGNVLINVMHDPETGPISDKGIERYADEHAAMILVNQVPTSNGTQTLKLVANGMHATRQGWLVDGGLLNPPTWPAHAHFPMNADIYRESPNFDYWNGPIAIQIKLVIAADGCPEADLANGGANSIYDTSTPQGKGKLRIEYGFQPFPPSLPATPFCRITCFSNTNNSGPASLDDIAVALINDKNTYSTTVDNNGGPANHHGVRYFQEPFPVSPVGGRLWDNPDGTIGPSTTGALPQCIRLDLTGMNAGDLIDFSSGPSVHPNTPEILKIPYGQYQPEGKEIHDECELMPRTLDAAQGWGLQDHLFWERSNLKGCGIGEVSPAATLHVSDTGRSGMPDGSGTKCGHVAELFQSPIAVDGLRHLPWMENMKTVVAMPDWRDPGYPNSKTDLLYVMDDNLGKGFGGFIGGKEAREFATPVGEVELGGGLPPWIAAAEYVLDTFVPPLPPGTPNPWVEANAVWRDKLVAVNTSDAPLIAAAQLAAGGGQPKVIINLPATGHDETSTENFIQGQRLVTVKDTGGNAGSGTGQIEIHLKPAIDPVSGNMQTIDNLAGGNGGANLCMGTAYGCMTVRASTDREVELGYPHWTVIG